MKPISHFKARTSRLIGDPSDNQGTLIVARNGRPNAVGTSLQQPSKPSGMRKHDIVVDSDAEDDFFDIYCSVALNDSVAQADRLFAVLNRAYESLRALPLRVTFYQNFRLWVSRRFARFGTGPTESSVVVLREAPSSSIVCFTVDETCRHRFRNA